MSDTTAPETTTNGRTAGMPADRRARFEQALEAVGHRTGRGDRRAVVGSVAVMVAGVVLAVVAYVTSTGQADTRDVLSSAILAVVGLSLVVAGGAVFVRSSMTEFLRFWMLRMIYEQQRGPDDG